MNRKQSGFTLVEIAIVLVIIGLLLGGILKGQELINSARVRNLADTTSGIQAAYYGFIDRYRRVPGDWNASAATTAIGVSINRGGDNNGRLDNPVANTYQENNGLWEQLSKAGFIQGAYTGGSSAGAIPDATGELTPLNAFNNVIVIGRTADYMGTSPVRLNVAVGRGVPVSIMRELDVKLDDGAPDTGVMRGAISAPATFDEPAGAEHGGMEAACTATVTGDLVWAVSADSQDCNGAYLY